jgi:hypothetical protein
MEVHGQDGQGNGRREPRHRVFKGGHIIFNHGNSVFDCRVRNLSTGGAMLEMPTLLGIPSHFDIALEDPHKHRPCTVMWRTNTLMGVAFDPVKTQAA